MKKVKKLKLNVVLKQVTMIRCNE